MRGTRARTALVSATIAVSLLVARSPMAAPTLPHLRGVEELKSWFNSGKGHPRLIFLLSPT